jgi:hypothetical protein
MKFNKFILEENESRSKEITEEEAWKIINEKCKKSINSTPIYRGISLSHKRNAFFIQPSKYERTSFFADHNIYTLLFDNLSSWKKFPKRSRSIICSTDRGIADSYGSGQVYRVYPFDGSNIGVCPDNDIWNSFFDDQTDFNSFTLDSFIINTVIGFIRSVNRVYDEVYEKDLINTKKLYDKNLTFNELKDIFSKVEKYIEDTIKGDIKDKNQAFHHFMDVNVIDTDTIFFPVFEKNLSFIKTLETIFDPIKNRFKLIKAGSEIGYDREVWTDGDSVLIYSPPITSGAKRFQNRKQQ